MDQRARGEREAGDEERGAGLVGRGAGECHGGGGGERGGERGQQRAAGAEADEGGGAVVATGGQHRRERAQRVLLGPARGERGERDEHGRGDDVGLEIDDREAAGEQDRQPGDEQLADDRGRDERRRPRRLCHSASFDRANAMSAETRSGAMGTSPDRCGYMCPGKPSKVRIGVGMNPD